MTRHEHNTTHFVFLLGDKVLGSIEREFHPIRSVKDPTEFTLKAVWELKKGMDPTLYAMKFY